MKVQKTSKLRHDKMSDEKYFQRGTTLFNLGKAQQLSIILQEAEKSGDTKYITRKNTLKKVVANISMGTDMSGLYQDILACLFIPLPEVKKMVYLYLITYEPPSAEAATQAISKIIRVNHN